MIQRDYIMRMIQQLSVAIAKVLFRIEQKQLPEAFREIDDACKSLIGTDWNFLRSLSDEQLVRLFGARDHPDKLLAASELLRQASRLLALEGRSDESVQQGLKAFSLFTELLMVHKQYAAQLSMREFAAVLAELEQYKLPRHIEIKRVRFYEMTGELAKAGNILTALIERDATVRQEGLDFCRRLEQLAEAELTRGGISRNSVFAWRKAWEASPLEIPKDRRNHAADP